MTKLKTIEEHNAMRRMDDEHRNTGVACPKCGHEFIYSQPAILLLSYPPRKNVLCMECGHHDSILA